MEEEGVYGSVWLHSAEQKKGMLKRWTRTMEFKGRKGEEVGERDLDELKFDNNAAVNIYQEGSSV